MTATTTLRVITSSEADTLLEGEGYADYIMNKTNAICGNGDMLIRIMERGDYAEDYLDSLGVVEED